MYSFTSNGDWFHVTSRGWVTNITKDQIPEGMWDPGVLSGQQVIIDGKEYKCRGVEMFRPIISPENPYHFDFGLLVSDEEYEANNETVEH